MRRPLASTALAALTRTALVLSVGTAASAASQGTDLPTLVQALRWRELGPARFGGRITDFAVVESDPRTFFAATASGGVWKTSNLGTTWTPVFDGYGPASVGAVAVAPSNPRVVWVGTGEPDNRQSSSWGDGIYRSTDGGRTWEHVGLRETRHVGRIVVHPKDSRIVYVAALGHLWGPEPGAEACSARRTEAEAGRTSSSSTRRPARSTWSWIRRSADALRRDLPTTADAVGVRRWRTRQRDLPQLRRR